LTQTVIPPRLVETKNVWTLVIVQKMRIVHLGTTEVFALASRDTLETHMGLDVHRFPHPQMTDARKIKIVQAKKHALIESV
jgi:hypothetical protein